MPQAMAENPSMEPIGQINMAGDDHQHLSHRADHDQRDQQQDDAKAVERQKLRFECADRQAEQHDHHKNAGFAAQQC